MEMIDLNRLLNFRRLIVKNFKNSSVFKKKIIIKFKTVQLETLLIHKILQYYVGVSTLTN